MRIRIVTTIIFIFLSALLAILGILYLFEAQGVSAQNLISEEQAVYYGQSAINQVELTLSKKAHPQNYDHIGQIINYGYTIKNTGTDPLTGPFSVADDKTAVTCAQPPDGVLSPNERMNCTATYIINQADLDTGTVVNLATASGGGATSNQATEIVSATQTIALLFTKGANPLIYDHTNQVISYSYVMTNTGNVTLSGPFTVTDDKATDESCPADATIAPGAIITCTASYSITQADLDAGSVTNTAAGHAYFGINPVDSNLSSKTVSASQNPSLTLVKSVTETSYANIGDVLHYSYMLTNTGNVTLAGPFTITDDKATDESCPADATLAPGTFITCTASYIITQADLDAGSVTNNATGHGYFSGNPITSNQDSKTVNAGQIPSLALVKSVTETSYANPGEILHYSYKLTNNSAVDLSGPFTITDDKATDESCPADATLAPGAFITCTASYTISQADLDTGSVTNIATGHGYFGGNPVTSNQSSKTVNAVQNPSLALVKSVTETSYANPGEVLHYSYNLTNNGNVTLSGPFTITDDKSTNESCPVTATLAPGAFITCTASYTITQVDLDAGSVTNIATGHGYFSGNPITSNQSSKTVNAIQNPSLALVKSVTETSYANPGDVLHYSFKLTNGGNVTLAGPFTITDDKSTNETCPVTATLAPGAFITCTASYIIIQADLDAGSVTNTATGHGNFSGNPITSNQSSKTVNASQNPSLALVKSVIETSYTNLGEVLHYSFKLTNGGNVTLTGPFTITDDKTTNESCPVTATLAPGAFITCTASYTITQADLDAGSVTNTATGHGYFGGNPITSIQSSKTVNAVQNPSLALVKSVNETSYANLGDILHYSFKLTNSGNVTLAGPFTITDDKSTNESCPVTATLAPGAFITCTASYTITQADLDAGSVTNIATGHGYFIGNPITSNQSSKTVNAFQNPSLTLVKSVTETSYANPGEVLHYSYRLTNYSAVTLSGPFTITDDKTTNESCPASATLAPGAFITCTASYTVAQADLDAGSVTNTATGHGWFSGNPITSNQDSKTVNATQDKSLLLTKLANPLTYSQVGQVIAYSFKVENNGNVTINAPFTVFDDMVTNETCPSSPTNLSPGQYIICTASYTIVASDITSGSVTNVAYATGKFGQSTVTSNSDTETITFVQTQFYTFLPTLSKPFAQGIYILPSSYYYVSHDTMFVIGEVLNNTDVSLAWVEVSVNFYDSIGQLVGTNFAYMWPLDLPARVKGCFKISMDVPANWSYYQFKAPTYAVGATSPNLVINNDNGSYNPINGDYYINGQVQNTGAQSSFSVRVGGTLYNNFGVPVGCEHHIVSSTDLIPGQVSDFNINFSGYYRNYGDVAIYRLRVAGDLP